MMSTGRGKVTELKQHREEKDKVTGPNRRRKKSRLFLLVGLAVMGTVVFSMLNQIYRIQMMQNNVDNIKSQVEDLKHKNDTLREEIKKMKSDSYIEQVAREQLGLVKPGETLVVQAQHAGNGNMPATPPKGKHKSIYD